MGNSRSQYELHPLCTLFPRMSGDDFAALCADIKANGLRQPIVLHDGLILDGGNRYRACIEAGVKPKFAKHDGSNLVQFVLSANLHRRHMTPGQQAAIVASAQDWAKAQPHGGDRRSDQAATLPLETVADRAAQSGASDRTQRMADKVVKADPDLGRQVAHGEVSLPAAVAKVENKPKPVRPEPEDKLRARIAELESEVADLREHNEILKQQAVEVQADNESMARVFESDEKLVTALAEAKRYREMNRLLEERVRGMQGEMNAAIRSAKGYKAKLDKMERAAA